MTERPRSPADLDVAMPTNAGDTYEWSKIMLASAYDGTLELLTAAWATTLGYGREELKHKTLGQLMGSGVPATTAMVASILDERNAEPLKLTLRCRNGCNKSFDLHRRHDRHGHTVYLMAEEISTALAQ